MPVCHHRKLSFCHIPRTGGVSVGNALQMEVKDRHFKASWYREMYPDYKLFTITRDYVERVKSTFGYKSANGKTIDELVEHAKLKGIDNIGLMLKPQEYFLDVQPDFILRFEFLQDDLDKMLTELGFDTVQLIQCNSFR
jgi:sulfur relay (sulfurtransferase) DsrC/TusE family protein